MKKIFLSLFAAGAVLLSANANEWVRINQLGYLPSSVKVAVMMSEDNAQIKEFELVDSKTKKTVPALNLLPRLENTEKWNQLIVLTLAGLKNLVNIYIKAGKAVFTDFPINTSVYDGTADFVLNYMRQQRCGYNPFLKANCHQHDAFIEYHLQKQVRNLTFAEVGTMPHLQYTTTSANAMYQMMLAYEKQTQKSSEMLTMRWATKSLTAFQISLMK